METFYWTQVHCNGDDLAVKADSFDSFDTLTIGEVKYFDLTDATLKAIADACWMLQLRRDRHCPSPTYNHHHVLDDDGKCVACENGGDTAVDAVCPHGLHFNGHYCDDCADAIDADSREA